MKRTKRTLAGMLCVTLCALALCTAVPAAASEAMPKAWDGTTIDVSWYNESDTEFELSTPEQLMGLAAIVNGLYNQEITTVIGEESYIVPNKEGDSDSGANGGNLSTDLYYYGADDFTGKTIYLTADLDMGGVCDPETGEWSGPRYMPIGGQYLMEADDALTKLSASFCGTLDGQGHYILNIYCPRRCTSGNYGDGQSIGLIGRLGVHDNDVVRPASPAVCNLAVTGFIEGNRSIGGIVGKIGKTTEGAVIENCANYATVRSTDAKGCGGIAGAGWNGGVVRNCLNAGTITSTYMCPTGGIVGSNEISIENCYNTGDISAARDSYAMAIGTTNSGNANADNCYWLTDSAPGGGYYSWNKGTVTELSEAGMKAAASKLGEAFTEDTGINGGYPILTWQAENETNPLAPPPAPVQPIVYTDIVDGIWYAEAVDYVVQAGYFDLLAEETFSPDTSMTRLMLAEALYRLEGSPEAEASPFDDCAEPSVAWAAKQGVVTGLSPTVFAPDDNIDREQVAVMLLRYVKLTQTIEPRGDLSGFTDRELIAYWAEEAMTWAVGEGLINGVDSQTLDPYGTTTRAQAAQLFLNFYNNFYSKPA